MRLRLSIAAIIAALPLIIFATVMIVVVNRQQQRSVEDLLRQATAAAVRTVDERIAMTRSALEMLATSKTLEVDDHAAFTDRAERALRQRPDWAALELRDRGGASQVIGRPDDPDARVAPTETGTDEAEAVLRFGEPRVSGIITAPDRRAEAAVAVSIPVFGENGVTHVLTAYVRAWSINRVLRDQGLAPGWVIAVLDDDQHLLARTLSDDPSDPLLGTAADESVGKELKRGSEFFFSRTRKGERVYTAAASSALTGWTVILGAPAAPLDVATQRTTYAVIGGGLAALVLALSLGWSLARSYAKREAAERRVVALGAAKAAEQRSLAILESTTDGVYELDRDWRITFINSRARHLIANGQDLTGHVLWQAFPEAVGTVLWDCYRHAAEAYEPVEFEAFYEPLNGWYAIRAFPSPEGLSVYFRDISAQKAAEEALKASEVRHRTLVEALPQLVWTCSPDGVCDFVSSQWLSYTGRSEAENLGYGWVEAIHPDDRERLIAVWQRSVATGVTFDTETRIRGADGTYRWFKQRAVPLPTPDGGVDRWFGTSTDITGLIEARDTMQAAKEEAERAAVLKSKFLASASHDLRQPMQSLFLFSGALHGHIQGDKGRAALENLERGLDVLKSLLDSLLEVSRLDAGVVKPTIEDFPVSLLLDHIAAGYAPVARSKGLEWTMAACPFHVRSDRVLLGRMVRNLVENAIRYTEQGGIEVSCEANADRLRIDILDTGVGINEDHLPRIFEEFHQVGNQERDRTQGLGLGLAIVQRISHLLEHPVSVRSEPGRGSTFSIEVPLGKTQPPIERGQATPAPATSGQERFAVVVDDDAIVLLGLQAILKEWGYEVLIAGSTEQAIEKLRAANRTPNIVIADYRLRDGRVGTDAILGIRGLFGTQIPGIIVTGETGPECQRDAAVHGFGLMHKPVTPRQLSSAMERYMTAAE